MKANRILCGSNAAVNFDNSYARLPERFFTPIEPDTAPHPRLLEWNSALADDLGLGALSGEKGLIEQIFSGNQLLDGSEPIALAYAGHQFGNFVPQLGDGRAVLLGELVGSRDEKRYDLQLKGSGQTPFSRSGDGKSSIGPVIREYILSEAMHRLGVPTTRALAAVETGEMVFRDSAMPAAVFTRVASSHIRIGTFEYFSCRRDLDGLRQLADYAIDRHYPEVKGEANPYVAFFGRVVEAQAMLVANWMSVGFIHGVMNTDNTSIAGETIDYGPCAFLDEFDYSKVFSSIDRNGRYAYGQQGAMAQWNLARLAECLITVGGEAAPFEAELTRFQTLFEESYLGLMRKKLGLTTGEEGDRQLISAWLQHLQDHQLDYTLSFRRLCQRLDRDKENEFGAFEQEWKGRIKNQPEPIAAIKSKMMSVNPLYIPRNHQVERSIQGAVEGDLSHFHQLNKVLQEPYIEQPGFADYANPPTADERILQTFCGT